MLVIKMKVNDLAVRITDYCKNNSIKKVYICGNGGSGKTLLSRYIESTSEKYGKVNLISTDDFIVDNDLRSSAKIKWIDDGTLFEGRYTSSNKESYFLKNIYEIIYNLEHGNNIYYFSKEDAEENKIRLLEADNFITIVEGVGTAFLNIDKTNSLALFLECVN